MRRLWFWSGGVAAFLAGCCFGGPDIGMGVGLVYIAMNALAYSLGLEGK